METKPLTLSQAKDYLGVTSQTLRNWDGRGVLKPLIRLGKLGHRRYSQEQLDDFIALSKSSSYRPRPRKRYDVLRLHVKKIIKNLDEYIEKLDQKYENPDAFEGSQD